jgi:hypothetical protein
MIPKQYYLWFNKVESMQKYKSNISLEDDVYFILVYFYLLKKPIFK